MLLPHFSSSSSSSQLRFSALLLFPLLKKTMITSRPNPATPGPQLNPTADEYIPLHHHHPPIASVAHLLPPPPMNIMPRLPWRHLPPPPTFLQPKILPPSRSPYVQIVWAPVPYAFPSPSPAFSTALITSDKPAPIPVQERLAEPAKGADSLVVRKRCLPPRQRHALPLVWTKKRSICRKRNLSDAPPDVESPFGEFTTSVMIRNIPNRIRQRELLNLLVEHCAEMNNRGEVESAFDLLYVPVDFAKRGNKGYAFVNFTTAAGAVALYRAWNNLEWAKFGYGTKKIRQIAAAKLQGDALKCHLERSRFECDTDEYLPVVLAPACNGFNLCDVTSSTIGARVKFD